MWVVWRSPRSGSGRPAYRRLSGVGRAAVRLPASRRRAAARIWRVISARVRSRAARSTDDRSYSVWLMITPCRAARSIAKFVSSAHGLPEVASPGVIRLDDGDRLDLRIGPVRKSLDGAERRMLAYNGSGAAQAATPVKLP